MDEKENKIILIGLIVALLVFFTFVFWFGNFLTLKVQIV